MYPDLSILRKEYFKNGVKIGKIRKKRWKCQDFAYEFRHNRKNQTMYCIYIWSHNIWLSKTVEKLEFGLKKAWLGIFEREKAVKTVF